MLPSGTTEFSARYVFELDSSLEPPFLPKGTLSSYGFPRSRDGFVKLISQFVTHCIHGLKVRVQDKITAYATALPGCLPGLAQTKLAPVLLT